MDEDDPSKKLFRCFESRICIYREDIQNVGITFLSE